jgi:SAM-dependent methyltransferase
MKRSLSFPNAYNDAHRAQAYSALEICGTYYLAFRDLPVIIAEYVQGRVALDFGCGTGRSTRFLKSLGFEVLGIDISASMIQLAKSADPQGSYRLVDDGDFSALAPGSFDLILSAFAFDNIADAARRVSLLHGLSKLLTPQGRMVLVDSAPEMYTHEWLSFTTQQFPHNRLARSGEPVQIVMTEVADPRPITDFLWFDEDYLRLFAAAGVELLARHHPLGRAPEPYPWQAELSIAPWVIYALGLAANPA